MTRTLKVIFATVLMTAGLAGTVVFLTGQGLDRAEKWVSLVGVFASVVISVMGLVLGWKTWRQGQAPSGSGGRVRRTGNATAVGRGSRANSGSLGAAPGSVVDRTGHAWAQDGAWANTGEDRPGKRP